MHFDRSNNKKYSLVGRNAEIRYSERSSLVNFRAHLNYLSKMTSKISKLCTEWIWAAEKWQEEVNTIGVLLMPGILLTTSYIVPLAHHQRDRSTSRTQINQQPSKLIAVVPSLFLSIRLIKTAVEVRAAKRTNAEENYLCSANATQWMGTVTPRVGNRAFCAYFSFLCDANIVEHTKQIHTRARTHTYQILK